MALPRKYNGLNFSYVPYVMAAEMVSRADAGFANIWGLQDCAETILKFADDAIKDEYLPRIYKRKKAKQEEDSDASLFSYFSFRLPPMLSRAVTSSI